MITMTIDPKRFANQRAAYDEIKKKRAIPRALESWCNEMGIPNKGQWIAKMELQKSGWPHWHVLLEVPWEFQCAEKGSFDEHWEFGFSNVRHRHVSVRYLAKYVAKGAEDQFDTVEASGLPSQGVKWVTASHGFWTAGTTESRVPQKKAERVGWPPDHWSSGELKDRVGLCRKTTLVTVMADGDENLRELITATPETVEMMLSVKAHLSWRFGFTRFRVPRGSTVYDLQSLGISFTGWWHDNGDERYSSRAGNRPICICL